LTSLLLRGQRSIPSRHLHSLVQDLLENKNIRLNDPTTEWDTASLVLFVGLEVLVMLGYVQRTKSVILPGNKEDVF
jgi:hypothetical protein